MGQAAPAEFTLLYQTHSSYVKAIARRLLRDTAAVEDVAQEVFLQAWRDFDRFDSTRGDLRAWLTVITRSRALDRLRRQARLATADVSERSNNMEADGHDPCRMAELKEGLLRVRGAWASLPPATRRIVELAYEENLSQRDIAARTGETLGVVKSRLRQAVLLLRAHAASPTTPAARVEDDEWALTTAAFDEAPTPAVELTSLHGLRVMVVDDDEPTREVLGVLLTRAGASPILQRSAADACRTLHEAWPDVLLTDIGMPGQDGYALMGRVLDLASGSGRRVAAIAFTAQSSEWDRARALRAGFLMHLSKPVHPIAVLAAIRRAADQPLPRGS